MAARLSTLLMPGGQAATGDPNRAHLCAVLAVRGRLVLLRSRLANLMCTSNNAPSCQNVDIYVKMQTVLELGEAVATRRRALGLKQGDVAARAGIPQETLSRFERGKLAELGSRKLLAVLAALGMELQFVETSWSGSLDELRRERGGSV